MKWSLLLYCGKIQNNNNKSLLLFFWSIVAFCFQPSWSVERCVYFADSLLWELWNEGAVTAVGFYLFWWNLLTHRQIFKKWVLTQLTGMHGSPHLSGKSFVPWSIPVTSLLFHTRSWNATSAFGESCCAVSWLLFLLGLLFVTFYWPDSFPSYSGKLPLYVRVCIFPKLRNISRKPWNNSLLLMLLTHNEYFIPRWTWVLNLKDRVVPNLKLGNEIYLNYIVEGSD